MSSTLIAHTNSVKFVMTEPTRPTATPATAAYAARRPSRAAIRSPAVRHHDRIVSALAGERLPECRLDTPRPRRECHLPQVGDAPRGGRRLERGVRDVQRDGDRHAAEQREARLAHAPIESVHDGTVPREH